MSPFDSNHCSSALTPLSYARTFQPQGKARAENKSWVLSFANLHLLLPLPWKDKGSMAAGLYPAYPALGSSSYQGSFPGLCHSQRIHHSFTSGLAALDNCLFCLYPNLPKATQRWRLHPNSKSQYSSLTTRPSSLSSFSGTYCLSVYAKYSIMSRKTRFPSSLFPASKGYVHLLF